MVKGRLLDSFICKGAGIEKKRPRVDFFVKEILAYGNITSSPLALSPRILARMPRKPYTTSFVALAPVQHIVGDTRHVPWVSSRTAQMRHVVLTHWVSQLVCLHLMTPLSESLRTDLHRHPFNASANWCRTLLCFGCPNSAGISELVLVAGVWFTTLDDTGIRVVSSPKLVVFRLRLFSQLFYGSVRRRSEYTLLLCQI